MKEQLPIGWKELPPVGDPLDAGTSEEEWDKTAHPRYPRKEIRLWVRGERYVRLCEVLTDAKDQHRYALHSGFLTEPSKDDDREAADDLAYLLIRAKVMMRLGGY